MDSNRSLFGENTYVSNSISQCKGSLQLFCNHPTLSIDEKKKISEFITVLDELNEKWLEGIGPCLQVDDISFIIDLGDFLSNKIFGKFVSSLTIPDRIIRMWQILLLIPDAKIFEVIMGQEVKEHIPNIPLFMRIQSAKNSTDQFIETIRQRKNEDDRERILTDISTILLTVMIRIETHEHIMFEMLDRASKVINKDIDMQDLFSINSKVKRGKEDRTDSRAIRDATAHAHFKVSANTTGDYIIKFENNDKGWKFNKEFSRQDLIIFYQDFDLLYGFYVRLISLKLLYGFLMTHGLKQIKE